jgi:LysM repeat protein
MSNRTAAATAAAFALLAALAPRAAAQEEPGELPLEGPDTASVRAFVRGPSAAEARWGEPFAVEALGRVAPREASARDVVWVGRGAPARTATRPAASTPASPPETGERSAPAGGEPGPGDVRRDAPAAPRSGQRTHTVAAGETVFGIAQQYEVTTAQLRVLNPDVDWERLPAGVELVLPATARIAAVDGDAETPPAGTREPARRPAPSAAGARTHTVVAGETFLGIARRYGVTAAQLRALNPEVDWERVRVGDVLALPASARAEGAAPSAPRAPAAASGARTHEVQAGETLFGIARRYGVTVDAIREANRMESDQVRTGQRLSIPER